MKTLLTFTLLVFTSIGFAQYPKMKATSDRIKTKAHELTTAYSKQLVLTGEQIPLFEETVEDYLVKAEEISETMDGKAELDALLELSVNETLRMNDILTQPQYRLYKKIKLILQPLKIVEEK